MSVVLQLSTLALKQVVEGACSACGLSTGGEAVVGFLTERFTDHSQRLGEALQEANESAWKALEIALAGESFWERCQALLARRENQAFGRQVRAFLDAAPLAGLAEQTPEFRQRCLQDLRGARQAKLLTGGSLAPEHLAQQAGAFARFAEPQAVLEAERRAIAGLAEELGRAGYDHLGRFLALRPPGGLPLLVVAVRYFFRRQVEDDPKLSQGLAYVRMEKLADAQEQGFASLAAALAQQGQRLEELLADVQAIVVETHGTVLTLQGQIEGQSEQIRGLGQAVLKLLEQHQLQRRELRPSDSLSVRNDAERQVVRQLVSRFRALPEEQQRRLPALLDGLGKLQVVAGDFEAAQRDFQKLAGLTTDAATQAQAHYHAYQAALQRQDWAGAMKEFVAAVRLDGRRLAPFPVGKYPPQRILGAGGFGVAFLCRHKYMNAPVVVKALTGADLDQGVEQVFAEAMALRQMDHPAVVRIQDCGFADSAHKARPYLVMDYFEGATLEQEAAREPLSQEACCAVGRQIAQGLQAAHARGILHRDVKPANVLVRREAAGWQVKLIDFGLALHRTALASSKASSKTLLGRSIAGTLEYAAPEQLGRLPEAAVGPASDVYGFGKTCCYALFQTPEPTLRHWRSIAAPLGELLGQCLEKLPARRPATFGEVLSRLSTFSPDEPPQAIPLHLEQADDAARRAAEAGRREEQERKLREAEARAEAEVRRKEEHERQLREAQARAEEERLRLEEQERRLREATEKAAAERRLLEEQRRRSNATTEAPPLLDALPAARRKNPPPLPADRRGAPAARPKQGTTLSGCGCLLFLGGGLLVYLLCTGQLPQVSQMLQHGFGNATPTAPAPFSPPPLDPAPNPPAPAVVFISDTFNRADADPFNLGLADLSLGGAGQHSYIPLASDGNQTVGARIASGALMNNGSDFGGVEIAGADGRGENLGQDLTIHVDVVAPAGAAGETTQAGPFFRSRAAAAGDGIIGGESAGYWVYLTSTGEVCVKCLNPMGAIACSGRPAAFESTNFHLLEVSVQGNELQAALDSQLLTFQQNYQYTTTVSVGPTAGCNDGAAGLFFGVEGNRGRAGNQQASGLYITAFRSLGGYPVQNNFAK